MVVAIILRAAVSVGLDKVDLPIVAVTIGAEVSIAVMTAEAESAVALSVSTTTAVEENAATTTAVEETSDDPNTAGVRTDLVGDTHLGMIPKADTPGTSVEDHPVVVVDGMDAGMKDVQTVAEKTATAGVIHIAEIVKVGVDQKGDTDATMTVEMIAVTAGGMIGMTVAVVSVVKVDEAAAMIASMRTEVAPTVPSTPARNAPGTAKSALTTALTSRPCPQIWIQRS